MTIGTRLFTWARGELVGTDSLGNRHSREGCGAKRRCVLSPGWAEGSKVPPEGQAGLNHTVNALPHEQPPVPWQKDHVPNLTGTAAAYRPLGALERGGHRVAATGDYEPWRPE